MMNLHSSHAHADAEHDSVSMPRPTWHAAGREHVSMLADGMHWMALMLDQIDYGTVLLSPDSLVLHANVAARQALGPAAPLHLSGGQLKARLTADGERLRDALAGARRGLRRMLFLGPPEQRVSVAVVPLDTQAHGGPGSTLLLIGKRQVLEDLSLQSFARNHGLTTAETWVLESLCRGLDAQEVATQRRVGLATVRSQIAAIRSKTGVDSIRQLICQVAALPPLLGLLRMAA